MHECDKVSFSWFSTVRMLRKSLISIQDLAYLNCSVYGCTRILGYSVYSYVVKPCVLVSWYVYGHFYSHFKWLNNMFMSPNNQKSVSDFNRWSVIFLGGGGHAIPQSPNKFFTCVMYMYVSMILTNLKLNSV